MKERLLTLLALGTAVVAPSTVAAQTAPNAQAPVALGKIPDQYICAFNGNVSRANIRAEAQRSVNAAGGELKHVYQNTIRGFSARIPAAATANFRARNPNIVYCEQDQVVRAVARPGSGGTTQPVQTTPWGITRVNGGGAYSGSAVAWVLDSGIDLDHPDLNVDVARSRSFVRDSSPNDANGHGTHVAGTIAALDNGIGVIGVVPGAPVVSVRVLDQRGSGSTSGVIAGVDYVADPANGRSGDVANMSLSGGASDALDAAVISAASKGIRFTLAAGNSSTTAINSSPARANGANIYTVSAFAQGDKWASFSNYGNPPVDVGEPGESIRSTYKDGGYATLSGTSMAAPHLAGILLLGPLRTSGTVIGDPDGTPDPIGVH